MAATASSARPKQQWKPSRDREQRKDKADSSDNRSHFEPKNLGSENATLASSSSSSSSSSTLGMTSASPASASRTSASPARMVATGKSSFVPYSAQDNAAAAFPGPENGGTDALEMQRVADLVNEKFTRLLRMQPAEFWEAVAMDTSIEASLESYLQLRSRWCDLDTTEGNVAPAGVIMRDQLILRRVFMLIYRMSLKIEKTGLQTGIDLQSKKDDGGFSQKRFFNLSRLLDICAIYGKDNQHLTMQLVRNAFSINAGLFDDLANTVTIISETVQITHQRCVSTLNMQLPVQPQEMSSGVGKIQQELLEVVNYLSDAVRSLCSLVYVYSEAAVVLALGGNLSNSGNQVLLTLELIHDCLIPIVGKSYSHLQGPGKDHTTESAIQIKLKKLRFYVIDLIWKLFSFSYLKESSHADSQEIYVNHLLEMYVCDPKERGEGFVKTFSGMVEESFRPFPEGTTFPGSLIRNVNRKHNLLEVVTQLQKKGLMSLDSAQYDYVVAIVSHTATVSSLSSSSHPYSIPSTEEISEVDVMNESKISHIKDILPGYGSGFIAACLEAYDNNVEEVIQRILEGTLHSSLQSLDSTLEVKPSSRNVSLPTKEKGKGKIDEVPMPKEHMFPAKQDRIQNAGWARDVDDSTERFSSSMSAGSSSVSEDIRDNIQEGAGSLIGKDTKGRFIRKNKEEESAQAVLDKRSADDVMRTVAYASQYEDEYDDSFDDLGTSVADGIEEAESLVNLARPKTSLGTESGFSNSRISSGGRSTGTGRGARPSSNGFSQETTRTTAQENKSNFNESQKKVPAPASRNRGRGGRREPRSQFFVKDGINYSYKVAGSVGVSDAEAAEVLNKKQRETIYGLGEGGNVPTSGNQAAHGRSSLQGTVNSKIDHDDSSGHAVRGRGRGGPRRENDHYNRKNRAMQKHFASLGGM